MTYVICNENNHYLHWTGKGYEIITDKPRATRWCSINKAKNVLTHNCIQEKQLNIYTWRIENSKTNTPVTQSIIVSGYKPTELNCNIMDKIKEIYTFTQELEQRKLYLIDQLHEVEAEIVDIEHAAEFYTLNASQGYKLYKLLHNTRIKRREIKDELQIIGLTLGTSIKSDSMKNLECSILGLDTRKYAPRVRTELFGV